MGDLVIFAAPALVLGILYCTYRALALFSGWRPTAAVVWSTDYPEEQQRDDFWGFGLWRGWRLSDGAHGRLIAETVHYRDEDGERHVADVKRYVRRGWRPNGAHVIWYDTADPNNATGIGPGHWLITAIALAIGLVAVIHAAMRIHG